MKKCNHCKQIKDETEFNRNRCSKDGLDNYCRECRNEYRRSHPRTDEQRAKHNERMREYRKDPWEKYKMSVRWCVDAAVKAGVLTRPDVCPVCGCKDKIQAHHEDYTKPLEVEWLCSKCHSTKHRMEKDELAS